MAIDDPVGFGQTRNGHGYGMSQKGAYRWAVVDAVAKQPQRAVPSCHTHSSSHDMRRSMS